ncbi:MAG: hypothetical protein ATN35_13460 [Epulopiscium sp. Nele67-Bin004]|nr:MAG: hypothetical protein ATN35_13460 [Epulopiscium sp. Nele67-Bin004]
MKKALKTFAEKAKTLRPVLKTEESAKTALVLPFFKILGYDIFNPTEFVTEYVADLGIKKGEKVDYAILLDDEPTIIIETKKADENLAKHYNQLYRYFGAIPHCKFSILTNGFVYQFFTDCLIPNVLDDIPFLTINLETLTDEDIKNLEMFCRTNLNVASMQLKAQTLLGYQLVNKSIEEALLNPSPELVDGIINSVSNNSHSKFLQELNQTFLTAAISQFYLDNHSPRKVSKPKKTVTKTIIVEEEIQEIEDDVQEIDNSMELSLKERCILQIENIIDNISYTKKEDAKYCSFYKQGENNPICSLLFKNNGNIVLVVPEGSYNKQYPLTSELEILDFSHLINN